METKLINLIIENGSYFKKDYDSKTNTVRLNDEAKQWYISNMGIKSDDETFMKFYNLVGTPPLGNSIQLLALDEIFENDYIKDNFVVIGDNEVGILIYDKSSGKFIEYGFQTNEIDSINDLQNKTNSWKDFKAFIYDYYEVN